MLSVFDYSDSPDVQKNTPVVDNKGFGGRKKGARKPFTSLENNLKWNRTPKRKEESFLTFSHINRIPKCQGEVEDEDEEDVSAEGESISLDLSFLEDEDEERNEAEDEAEMLTRRLSKRMCPNLSRSRLSILDVNSESLGTGKVFLNVVKEDPTDQKIVVQVKAVRKTRIRTSRRKKKKKKPKPVRRPLYSGYFHALLESSATNTLREVDTPEKNFAGDTEYLPPPDELDEDSIVSRLRPRKEERERKRRYPRRDRYRPLKWWKNERVVVNENGQKFIVSSL